MNAGVRAWTSARTSSLAFYGWRVVGGTFVLAVFGWGVGFYGPPVYPHALHEMRGLRLALLSAHFSPAGGLTGYRQTLIRRATRRDPSGAVRS